ncbi:MAG: thioredoxin [Fimbriimonadia bacterium]|nr:thioredoxin [Fimbriimonadia bacterium]
MANATAVSKDQWTTEVLGSSVPVLVDFWAVWCGPCKVIAPFVDQIAAENAGKLEVRKVDVDSEQELAMQYGIMSIPTLLLFKGGQVVEQIVGAIPKSAIEEKVKRHL